MIADGSFDLLIAVLKKFAMPSPALALQLRPLLHEMMVEKGEVFLPTGVKHHLVFFIINGVCMEAIIHPETNKKETSWMWFSGDFIYVSPGFFSQQSAGNSVEALQECRLIYITYLDFISLRRNHEEVGHLTELIRDHYTVALKRHALDLASLTNKQRYDQFIKKHPKALLTLSHKPIASFLGILDKGLGRYSKK